MSDLHIPSDESFIRPADRAFLVLDYGRNPPFPFGFRHCHAVAIPMIRGSTFMLGQAASDYVDLNLHLFLFDVTSDYFGSPPSTLCTSPLAREGGFMVSLQCARFRGSLRLASRSAGRR